MRFFKRILAFLAIFAFVFSSSCTEKLNNMSETGLTVVASLFPQYDFARQIAGDKISVVLLLPPGAETHIFEPSPKDMQTVTRADAFIYTGGDMEPWAEKIIGGANVKTLNLCEKLGYDIDDHDHESHDYTSEEEHSVSEDPHIWLSPDNAEKMIEEILALLCELDRENSDYYTANAEKYLQTLNSVYSEYAETLQNAKRDTVVFGGRFAFYHFVEYYGLNYVSVFDSCSTEAEPSISDVARVSDFIKVNAVPVIFHEELADPKIARTIAEETGAGLMLFSTAHNVTKAEFEQGITFADVMRANLESLHAALN